MVLAEPVQCPLRSCGADAERLSMAVRRDIIVSLMGLARIACSSTSLLTPPLRITVILVVGEVLLDWGPFRPRDFAFVVGAGLAMAAAYRDCVFIQGCWGVFALLAGVILPAFRAASAGVGSGRGGMGGGCEVGAGVVGAAVGVVVTLGACFGGLARLVGAGKTTRGSLVGVGLEARGI